MKKLSDLYNYASSRNIKVKRKNLNENIKGACLYNIEKCKIYLDKNISEIEERCILAEEIGHYEKGIIKTSLYDQNEENYLIRSVNEFRAKKWAAKELIPFHIFKKFWDKNYSKYEVANELGVTEELLDMACFIYEPYIIQGGKIC